MMDLKELYQEIILDHNRKPRNFGVLENANREAHGHNPLCGDQLHLTLVIDGEGVIQDLRFEGKGCAISTASASMMTQHVKGRRAEEVETLLKEFNDVATGRMKPEEAESLGKLKIFAGV
ncbi:MAG: SUF system NifU family Fe-S cluster assembly protein, partial [Candidatus Cloacimonetes bacterium]|nr:SUF system NifU family Fe-S cluster assembly protein [Candidatus Cloacimonadota bacterium]